MLGLIKVVGHLVAGHIGKRHIDIQLAAGHMAIGLWPPGKQCTARHPTCSKLKINASSSIQLNCSNSSISAYTSRLTAQSCSSALWAVFDDRFTYVYSPQRTPEPAKRYPNICMAHATDPLARRPTTQSCSST